MKKWFAHLAFAVATTALVAPAAAKGPMPEDMLKGRIIVSDQRLPMRWTSVPAYVSQMKALSKSKLEYDKKTGKVKIEYAAFFAQPVQDVQVNLVIADITPGVEHKTPSTNEQFMTKGQRVLFNSITLDKEDYEMNRKYRFTVVGSGHKVLASTEFTLIGEGPHYSGHVEFTDEETKKKD